MTKTALTRDNDIHRCRSCGAWTYKVQICGYCTEEGRTQG